MADDNFSQELRDRIKILLKETGLNVSKWCQMAAIPESTLRNFLSGRSETMTLATMAALARAIDVPLRAMIYAGTGVDRVDIKKIIVADEVSKELNTNEGFDMDVPRDIREPLGKKIGFIIGDDHCDQLFNPGDIVVLSSYEKMKRRPQVGDITVITETRAVTDGFEDTYSVRELIQTNGSHWLAYRSKSPKWVGHTKVLPPALWPDMGDGGLTWALQMEDMLIQFWGVLRAAYQLK